MTITYIGVVNGLHTWEVTDEDGEVVGYNQRATFEEEVASEETP